MPKQPEAETEETKKQKQFRSIMTIISAMLIMPQLLKQDGLGRSTAAELSVESARLLVKELEPEINSMTDLGIL